MRADFAVLAAAFDALVAVLVQIGEVLPQFLIAGVYDVTILDRGELRCEGADGGDVEFVLMGLEHHCIRLSPK